MKLYSYAYDYARLTLNYYADKYFISLLAYFKHKAEITACIPYQNFCSIDMYKYRQTGCNQATYVSGDICLEWLPPLGKSSASLGMS